MLSVLMRFQLGYTNTFLLFPLLTNSSHHHQFVSRGGTAATTNKSFIGLTPYHGTTIAACFLVHRTTAMPHRVLPRREDYSQYLNHVVFIFFKVVWALYKIPQFLLAVWTYEQQRKLLPNFRDFNAFYEQFYLKFPQSNKQNTLGYEL